MAIKPYYVDGDGPPCALKIGPINCFCVWDGDNNPLDASEAKEADSLTIAPPPVTNRQIVHDRPAKGGYASLRDDSTQAESSSAASRLSSDIAESSSAASSAVPAVAAAASSAGTGQSSFDHPLLAVVRMQAAHLPVMQRQLREIEASAATGCPDSTVLDRLRQLVTQHGLSVEPSDWPAYAKGDNGLEFGAKTVDGTSQWFRRTEYRGCDITKALAAILEADLHNTWNSEVVGAEPLGVHTARRDAIWRVFTENQGKRQESVWSYGFVDALDQPIGSLLVFAHTPPDSRASSSGGLSLLAGQVRGLQGTGSEYECVIHALGILQDSGGSSAKPCGLRLTQMGVSTLANPVQKLTLKDSEPDPRAMREQEIFQRRLLNCLEEARQLDERMRMSPRTDIYERVKKHVARRWPAPKMPQPTKE